MVKVYIPTSVTAVAAVIASSSSASHPCHASLTRHVSCCFKSNKKGPTWTFFSTFFPSTLLYFITPPSSKIWWSKGRQINENGFLLGCALMLRVVKDVLMKIGMYGAKRSEKGWNFLFLFSVCFFFFSSSSDFKVLYLLYLKLGEGNDWSEKEISRNMCVYIFTVMECLVKIDFWRHLVGIGPFIYILYDLILLVFLSYVFFVSSKLYQFRKWREEQNSKILYTKKKKSEINPKWISC